MKKTYLRAAIGCLVLAIFGMAVTFTACKKDADTVNGGKIKASANQITDANYFKTGSFTSGAPGSTTTNNAEVTMPGVQSRVAARYNLRAGFEYKNGQTTNILNEWFEDFHVTKDGGNTWHSSYCGAWYADYLASGLGDITDARFGTPEGQIAKANILKAFSYIYETWGSIDQWPTTSSENGVRGATKIISQMVLWQVLNDGVESLEIVFENCTYDATWLNQYVTQVMGNYSNYTGFGWISDVVFLGFGFQGAGTEINLTNQHQLVPVYADPTTYEECDEVNATFSMAMYTFGTEFETFKKGTPWNPDGNSNNVNQCMLMPGYSSWHTIYNFYVKDQYENEYFSFCASWGSSGEGFVSEKNPNFTGKQFDDIKGVLNYIYNKYGTLDAWGVVQGTGRITNDNPAENTKIVAQIAIWSILGQDVTVDIGGHAMPNIMEAVRDALNHKDASGIIGIYYLGGDDYPGDIMSNQPQIVPVCEECEVNFHSLSFWGEEHGLVDFFGHLYEHHDAYQNDLTPALFRLFEEWYVYEGHTSDGKGHWVDPSCCHFPVMNCDLWDKLADVLTSVEQEGGNNWEYDNGTNEYYLWLKTKVAEELKKLTCIEITVASGLNWNNGTVNNGNGANGGGLIQFTVDGFTFKNNKNYVTPANFAAAIATNNKPSNTDIYTVTERATSKLGDKKADKYTAPITGKYTKIYYVQVAMYRNGEWKIYEGTITVDNPGGNNDKQKVDIFRIYY